MVKIVHASTIDGSLYTNIIDKPVSAALVKLFQEGIAPFTVESNMLMEQIQVDKYCMHQIDISCFLAG